MLLENCSVKKIRLLPRQTILNVCSLACKHESDCSSYIGCINIEMVEGRGIAGIAGSAGHFDCGYEVSEVRKGYKERKLRKRKHDN